MDFEPMDTELIAMDSNDAYPMSFERSKTYSMFTDLIDVSLPKDDSIDMTPMNAILDDPSTHGDLHSYREQQRLLRDIRELDAQLPHLQRRLRRGYDDAQEQLDALLSKVSDLEEELHELIEEDLLRLDEFEYEDDTSLIVAVEDRMDHLLRSGDAKKQPKESSMGAVGGKEEVQQEEARRGFAAAALKGSRKTSKSSVEYDTSAEGEESMAEEDIWINDSSARRDDTKNIDGKTKVNNDAELKAMVAKIDRQIAAVKGANSKYSRRQAEKGPMLKANVRKNAAPQRPLAIPFPPRAGRFGLPSIGGKTQHAQALQARQSALFKQLTSTQSDEDKRLSEASDVSDTDMAEVKAAVAAAARKKTESKQHVAQGWGANLAFRSTLPAGDRVQDGRVKKGGAKISRAHK